MEETVRTLLQNQDSLEGPKVDPLDLMKAYKVQEELQGLRFHRFSSTRIKSNELKMAMWGLGLCINQLSSTAVILMGLLFIDSRRVTPKR